MKYRAGKIGLVLLVALAASGAAPLSTGVALASTGPAPAPVSTSILANTALNSPLGSLPDEIAQLGSTTLRSVYTGLVVTDSGRHIDVYLTSLTPHVEAPLQALSRAGTVSFRKAPHSEVQLLAVQSAVTRAAESLAARGIQLVSWFPGVNGDGLENIGVLNLTRAHAQVLRRLFGAGNIVLQNVTPSEVPTPTGRNSDSSPWNGGDNLTSSGIGCTSGVGINYNGTAYMITAAHCYVPGWTIYNALAGQKGTRMGTEHSRDVSNGGDDTALLSMTPSDLVWTGSIGQPTRTLVTGLATNPDGDTVCNEGAYSGEDCVKVVNNGYGCATVFGYTGLSRSRTECNLVEAQASNGGIANQDGDSGGPMIRYINGGLRVTGIISLGGGSNPACIYNTPDTCYSTVYYTAMDEIVGTEYPGSAIITG